MTRLSFTIPLRESFGFPFLYAQIAVVTAYFKQNISVRKEVNCPSETLAALIGLVMLQQELLVLFMLLYHYCNSEVFKDKVEQHVLFILFRCCVYFSSAF